jgi:hypothetical protein
MTSNAAPVNWTVDGTDMVDIDGVCLHTLVRGGPGETAQTRGEADVIPGLPGMAVRLWEVERRVIEFSGFVRGTGSDEAAQRDDYWDNRIALATTLDPTELVHIVITLPGGAVYSIDARPLPPIGYNQRVPSFAECSVEFESFDPDWTSGS